ncbi:MAG: hypothetical protein AAF432_15875, partial [Planctomycetota bacterium]
VRGLELQSPMRMSLCAALLIAGRVGGMVATIGAAIVASIVLLVLRNHLARIVAPLPRVDMDASKVPADRALDIDCVRSDDEGFTGGIVGVFRPRRNMLPARWADVLSADGLRVARQRREIAVDSGSWYRGRWAALTFTWAGVVISALLVGESAMGTAGGVITLSFIFTIWSFAGLLVLPTLSRSGVTAIDERLRASGIPAAVLDDTVRALDGLQDAEPERSALVESIFHPIPSVNNRLDGPRTHHRRGFWDVARSAIFLSASGLGLLGRAVHCNCGRPALWVYLPSD